MVRSNVVLLVITLWTHSTNAASTRNRRDLLSESIANLVRFSCGPIDDHNRLNGGMGIYFHHPYQSSKNALLFAFNLEAGEPYNYLQTPKMILKGQSVELVKAVCEHIGACCQVLAVRTSACWSELPFPGFSEGLNAGWYDICVDTPVTPRKKLTYKFSKLEYWQPGGQNLKMMVRKNAGILVDWWDSAFSIFACSGQFETFCQKYNGDEYANCIDVLNTRQFTCGGIQVNDNPI